MIGVISVVLTAKGNILGAFLGIIQAVFYSIISYSNAFYGEVILYLAILIPLYVILIIQWFKNLSKEDAMVVKVNKLRVKEIVISFSSSILVFVAAFFILKLFNTANLLLSAFSFATCGLATYFNLRRDKIFFLIFIFNNLVVVSMWIISVIQTVNLSILPVTVCSATNIFTNIYGFINWTKLYKKQNPEKCQINFFC